MQLDIELKFFDQKRKELLAHHQGKFALIKEQALIDVFDSAEAAFVTGVQRFGNVPFLVKQILSEDPVEHLPALIYGLTHASL